MAVRDRSATARPRRGAHEGTIYRRSDGRWVAGVTGANGKRKFFYGRTRLEVSRKLSIAQRNQAVGLPMLNDRIQLARFLEEWLEEKVKPTVRPYTYNSYEVNVRVHIVPELGRIPLTQLTPQQVQRFINAKLASGLAPKTVTYIRQTLHAALAHAERWGLVHRNVASLTEMPRRERREMTVFTTAEAHQFLDAIEGDRLEALYRVALTLGLRQGEALGLQWSDVDFDGGALHVRHGLQRFGGEYHLVPPKTAKSRRVIPLPRAIAAALLTHRARQKEERLRAGPAWDERWDLVFTRPDGRPLDHTSVTNRFRRLLREAGLPHLRFHDLRHSCATLLLVQGVAPRVVMEILGHSDIAMTMNTYTHVLPELQRQAAQRMDDFLSGTG